MQSQACLLNLMFSTDEINPSFGFSKVRLNKACCEDLKSAACEAVFTSFDSQLMGREDLARWLIGFPEDLIRNKYMDVLEALENMAMQPANKKLDHFLSLENDIQ